MEKININLPILVKLKNLKANDYNPNIVAKPEMELLEKSIKDNGFCFPIIVMKEDNTEDYIIIDGFHRHLLAKKLKMEYVPVVVLDLDIKYRISATIQFNRAKGTHQINDMSSIVKELFLLGWDDTKIAKHLGMDPEEIIRLKQFTGMADLFKDHAYSKSWE